MKKLLAHLIGILLVVSSWAAIGQSPEVLRYFYDGSGELFRVLDSAGNLVEYIYDPSGNIIQINRSTVAAGALSILNITPLRGPAGTILKIYGQDFSAMAAGDLVQINGVTAVVISATATELDVLVPTGVTSGQITVTVNGVTVSSGPTLVFTAASAPVITSITPDGAIAGTVLPSVAVTGTDLTGASFAFPAGATATALNTGSTTATLRVSALAGRQTVPLVATTTAGSSTSSVTSGNHFVVMVSPDAVNTQAISVLNTAAPASGTTDPTNVSNQAMSAVISLLNTSTPSSGGVDPTDIANQAMSPVISLLNQSSSLNGAPDATNVSNEADSYLISLLNNAAATMMKASPLTPMVEEVSTESASAGPLKISSSTGSSVLIAGQQLNLSVSPPAQTNAVQLDTDGVALEKVSHAPYAFKLNVPATSQDLNLKASAWGSDNTQMTALNWDHKVIPDPGTRVVGRVVDKTGSPIAGAEVTVRTSGMFAEYFKIDSSSGAIPGSDSLKASVKRLESGMNWINPSGVFGTDPIGTGLPKYLAHFKAELTVENEGLYAFTVSTNGTAQLLIDGHTIAGSAHLVAGRHPLELNYLSTSGSTYLQLLWMPPGGRQSAIPDGDLIASDPTLISISTVAGEFAIPSIPAKVSQISIHVKLLDGRVVDSIWLQPTPGVSTDFGDIVVEPIQRSKEQK